MAERKPVKAGQRQSYARGLSFELVSYWSTILLGIGASIAIARLYGASVLGEYALVAAPMMALSALATVREQAAFVRRVAVIEARAPAITGLFLATFGFSTVLATSVALLVLIATWFAFQGPIDQPDLFLPAVVAAAGYVVVENPCWNLDRVFTAFRAGPVLLRIRLTQALLLAALSIAGGIVWDNVWGLVVADIATWAVVLVYRVVAVRRYMLLHLEPRAMSEGWKELPSMVTFGLKLVPGTMAESVVNQSGTWIIGAVAPVGALGAYSRAWLLSRRLLMLRGTIAEMLFPTLVERRERGDREGQDRVLVDTLRYTLSGMLLFAAAGGGAAVGVMELFGPGFERASDALALLLLAPPIAIASFLQFQSLWAADRPLTSTIVSLVRMVVAVPLMVVLTKSMGITGTALALVVGYAFGFAWICGLTLRNLSTPFFRLWTVRQVLAVPVAYVGGFAAAHWVDGELGGPLGLLAALTAGSAAYLVLILVIGGLGPRDRERLGKVLVRLPVARHVAPRLAQQPS